MNKIIYVAGPFRAKNAWLCELNVRRAEEHALEIWRMGLVAICPHANTWHFQGVLPDQTWLDGDLEILRRCDAVFLLPHWQASQGTFQERELAQSLGKPIFDSLGDLREWAERQHDNS